MRRYERYEYDRGYRDGRYTNDHRDYREHANRNRGDTLVAHLTYGLYACGIFTGALTTLAGLLLAYVARDHRDPFSASHFSFLIDTFWSALFGIIVLGFVTVVLVATIVGILPAIILWLLFSIWYILRIVRGWASLTGGEYAPNS